jgi:hypothetical protein
MTDTTQQARHECYSAGPAHCDACQAERLHLLAEIKEARMTDTTNYARGILTGFAIGVLFTQAVRGLA